MGKANRGKRKQPLQSAKRPGSGKFKRNRGSTLHLQHFDDIATESYTPLDFYDDLLLRPPCLDHLDVGDDDGSGLMEPTIDQPYPASPPTLVPQVPEDDLDFYFDARPSDITFDNSINDNTKYVKNPPIKTKKQRKKAQKAGQIIPGDDIYFSCDDEFPSDDETTMAISKINDDDSPLKASFNNIDVGAGYSDEAAIDQDFIENTDPETWQQLQQWATQRSVIESDVMDQQAADEATEEAPISSYIQPNTSPRDIDFGLIDSDDDEYIRKDKRKRNMSKIVGNTMDIVPPSLHAGLKAYQKYDRKQKKLRALDAKEDLTCLAGQLHRVDRRIRQFYLDTSRNTYQFPAMSEFCRKQVRDLANVYGIQVIQDLGSEKMQVIRTGPLLMKTNQNGRIFKPRRVERHITHANEAWVRETNLREQQQGRRHPAYSSDMISLAPPQRRSKRSARSTTASRSTTAYRSITAPRSAITKPAEHIPVGSDARPLESSNIGHKMLAKMGWKVGDSLGANNDGILNPIQAVVRQKNRGLGS